MKWIFTVVAYERATGSELTDAVRVIIAASTDTEALKQAKKLIKKPNYRVADIRFAGSGEADGIVSSQEERRHREWIENCDKRHFEFKQLVEKQHVDYLDLAMKNNELMAKLVKATEMLTVK